MLADREREREPPLVDIDPLPHCVEDEPEHGTVYGMDNEPEPAIAEADEQHVGVIAAEDALIKRLQQPPSRRGRRTGDGSTCPRCHAATVLERCQKVTPSTEPRAASRCSSARSSRSRRPTRARP
jgi:hypothetical protein